MWLASHQADADEFDEQLNYQRHFRSLFDFMASDEPSILSTMASAQPNGAYEKWGLHLSDVELAELNRRDEIEFARAPVAAAIMATGLTEEHADRLGLNNEEWMGSAYAGSWIDQMDSGLIKLAIKSGADFEDALLRAQQAIADVVRDERVRISDFEIVEVEFSLAEITDVGDLFFAGPHRDFINGFAYYPSFELNSLVLEAEPHVLMEAVAFASEQPEGLVTVLPVELGSTQFWETSPPAWTHDHPHAGVKIAFAPKGGGTTDLCTWGFTARTTSYVYAIVAAHCLPGHTPSVYQGALARAIVTAGGHVVSTSAFTYGYNGERGEVGRAMLQSSIVDDHNCYHADADCATRIARRETTDETGVGETKCASLRIANDYRCGTVLTENWSGSVEGIQRKWMRQMSYPGLDGDSGAGWKESTLAMGIGSFGSGNTTLVTHMYYVETRLGVTTCGTSGVCD